MRRAALERGAARGATSTAFAAVLLALAPTAPDASGELDVFALRVTDYPQVTIDIGLPPGYGHGERLAADVSGADVISLAALDPSDLAVEVVIDDRIDTTADTLLAGQGASVELVRLLDRGTSIRISTTSGLTIGPTADREELLAGIARMGESPAANDADIGQAVAAAADSLRSRPEPRKQLIALLSTGARLDTAELALARDDLATDAVALLVATPAIDPDDSVVELARGGLLVAGAGGIEGFLPAIDGAVRRLTDQYRITVYVRAGGGQRVVLTVDGRRYSALIDLTDPRATAPPEEATPSVPASAPSALPPAPPSEPAGTTEGSVAAAPTAPATVVAALPGAGAEQDGGSGFVPVAVAIAALAGPAAIGYVLMRRRPALAPATAPVARSDDDTPPFGIDLTGRDVAGLDLDGPDVDPPDPPAPPAGDPSPTPMPVMPTMRPAPPVRLASIATIAPRVNRRHVDAVRLGHLCIEPDRSRAFLDGRTVALSPLELAVLSCFASRPDEVISAATVAEAVSDQYELFNPEAVSSTIGRLRRKLEAGGRPRILHDVRGGFVLRGG